MKRGTEVDTSVPLSLFWAVYVVMVLRTEHQYFNKQVERLAGFVTASLCSWSYCVSSTLAVFPLYPTISAAAIIYFR